MNGEGKIRLKVYHGEGDTLGISIRDNGIGMDAGYDRESTGKRQPITKSRQSSGSNGIAMGNVIARLKLSHPERRCHDDPAVMAGTRARK
ncbi:MAG: sensor histidine kinase [Waltera sp.]